MLYVLVLESEVTKDVFKLMHDHEDSLDDVGIDFLLEENFSGKIAH
jgi:hypothetical protein